MTEVLADLVKQFFPLHRSEHQNLHTLAMTIPPPTVTYLSNHMKICWATLAVPAATATASARPGMNSLTAASLCAEALAN